MYGTTQLIRNELIKNTATAVNSTPPPNPPPRDSIPSNNVSPTNSSLTCNICQKTLSSAWSLRRHIRSHTGEKPFVCDYPDCSASFLQKSALTEHYRSHTGEKPYECEYCSYKCSRSDALNRHKRHVHKELLNVNFEIKVNDSENTSKPKNKRKPASSLNTPNNTSTSSSDKVKNYQCPHCTYRSDRADAVKRHISKLHKEFANDGTILKRVDFYVPENIGKVIVKKRKIINTSPVKIDETQQTNNNNSSNNVQVPTLMYPQQQLNNHHHNLPWGPGSQQHF